MKTWTDSLKSLAYSPGWVPEYLKPVESASVEEQKEETPPRVMYFPTLPVEVEAFAIFNFLSSMLLQQSLLHFSTVSTHLFLFIACISY